MNPTGKKMKDWKTTFDKQFDHWPNCDGYDSEGNCNCGFTQVRDFISSLLSSQLKEVLGVIESKKIQPEYVGRDDVDISYFVNSALDKVKAELSQLAEGEK
jgi:hypothetical protein